MSNIWIQELLVILLLFLFVYFFLHFIFFIFNKKFDKRKQKIYWGGVLILIAMIFIWGTIKRNNAKEEQRILEEKLLRSNIIDSNGNIVPKDTTNANQKNN